MCVRFRLVGVVLFDEVETMLCRNTKERQTCGHVREYCSRLSGVNTFVARAIYIYISSGFGIRRLEIVFLFLLEMSIVGMYMNVCI